MITIYKSDGTIRATQHESSNGYFNLNRWNKNINGP